jgi:hypothetical protein
MPTIIRAASVVALLVIVAACSGSSASGPPSVAPTGQPSGSPTASPADAGAIEHPTGATDVILRYDVGGGMTIAGWTASQVPIFTLYGDGTVIFRNPMLELPPAQGSVMRTNPLRTARLSEAQIQEVLGFAIVNGGLGVARDQYDNPMVADAGSAIFTVDAGGIRKTVSVYALGMETEGVPDIPARLAFNELATRLADFDAGGSIATDIFVPTTYRGTLMDGTGMVVPDVIAWPWKDIIPSDFVGPADPNAFQMATRTLTPEEVAELGVDGPEGGFQGLIISGPGDGKQYAFAMRPLLPDDKE